jgi:CheY-like chemotaxis protein
MYKLLLVTANKDSFSDFASTFSKHSVVELSWAESGGAALDMVENRPIDLVVVDEDLGDMRGLKLAFQLLFVNPMINCAVASDLSHEDFHEASEGLGLMAQLPLQPGAEQVDSLFRQLKKIKNISG